MFNEERETYLHTGFQKESDKKGKVYTFSQVILLGGAGDQYRVA